MSEPFGTDTAAAEDRGPFVGFAVCGRRSRILRVRVASRARKRMAVTCPHGCGEHVTDNAMPRRLHADETPPELVELPSDEDAPTPPDPDDPTALHGRQTVTDAAILEAMPDRDTLATVVAAAVGYGNSNNLLRRLHRMNTRAAQAGEAEPFVITARGKGRPTMVRRAET